MTDKINNSEVLGLTADVVSAYVSNNSVSTEGVVQLIADVHGAFGRAVFESFEDPKLALTPAVPPKKSITPDYLICLEDGKKFKSLKRHLKSHYDLTPEQYREKWGLAHDYPMVAPNYAAARSKLAKEMGLGKRS